MGPVSGKFIGCAEDRWLKARLTTDALNEWADEELGDFLLDGDNPVNVNVSILSKQP